MHPSTGATSRRTRRRPRSRCARSRTILRLPFTRNESGSYAWPTAYSENPTEDAWRDLVYSGLYSAEEVDQMKTQGTGYLGYRTAITPDGDWQFFVAGD